LILPKGYSSKFIDKVASMPENERVLFREHVVRKGDTLGAIASRYGSTVIELRQANNLRTNAILRIGQTILVPMSGVAPSKAAMAARMSAPVRSTTTSVYTVRRGDTLYGIASRFNVSVEQLKRWNNLPNSRLSIGKKLLVADKVVHRVKPGETLIAIASTYKTSVDAILSWNKTNDLSVIHPGDQITIFLKGN
jgi:membrane-bound lytic murein transglycosylase D